MCGDGILPDAVERTVHQVGSLAMDATVSPRFLRNTAQVRIMTYPCMRCVIEEFVRSRQRDVCNVLSPFAHDEQLQASNRQSI